MNKQEIITLVIAIWGAALSTILALCRGLNSLHWIDIRPQIKTARDNLTTLEVEVINRSSFGITIKEVGFCVGPRKKGEIILVERNLKPRQKSTWFWSYLPLECDSLLAAPDSKKTIASGDSEILSTYGVNVRDLKESWCVYVRTSTDKWFYSAHLWRMPLLNYVMAMLGCNGRFLAEAKNKIRQDESLRKDQAEVIKTLKGAK